MRGRYVPSKNENSYRCVSNEENYRDSRKVKCSTKRSINRVGLEKILWIKILEIFQNSELVKEEFRNNNLPKEYDVKNTKKKLQSIDKTIIRLRKKIELINNRLEENTIKNITLKITDNMFENIQIGVEKELLEIDNRISGYEIQKNLLENNNVWEEWLDSFIIFFNKICDYKKDEDKRKFLHEYVERIYVQWDKDTNTHNIKIQFKLNIVKDKGELMGNDIYKIKKGRKIVGINGINVINLRDELIEKQKSTTHILTYSTVTLLARLRG